MRHGVPTTNNPDDQSRLYFRCLYHEFWWGPFSSEEEVAAAMRTLDAADPMWDYDCFTIHYGVRDMKDALRDPLYITKDARDRIEGLRGRDAPLARKD